LCEFSFLKKNCDCGKKVEIRLSRLMTSNWHLKKIID